MSHHYHRVTRINAEDPYDLALWALVLDVSPAAIQTAVHQVGGDAADVQAFLRKAPAEHDSGE